MSLLFEYTVKASVLIGLALVMTLLLRRRSAALWDRRGTVPVFPSRDGTVRAAYVGLQNLWTPA